MVRSNAALERELDKLKKAAKALAQKAERLAVEAFSLEEKKNCDHDIGTWAYCLFNNLSNRISDPEGAGLRD